MDSVFERIKECVKNDAASSYSQAMMYIVEEVGELATCIEVEEGLKDKNLTESKESEACDLILSTLGIIARNPEWTLEMVFDTISKKLPKWESRVKGVKNVEVSKDS